MLKKLATVNVKEVYCYIINGNSVGIKNDKWFGWDKGSYWMLNEDDIYWKRIYGAEYLELDLTKSMPNMKQWMKHNEEEKSK